MYPTFLNEHWFEGQQNFILCIMLRWIQYLFHCSAFNYKAQATRYAEKYFFPSLMEFFQKPDASWKDR